MDSTRWQRIQELFHGAADLPRSEQQAFVKQACDGDDELISEVLAMLDQDASGELLFDRSLADVAHQTLAPLPLPLKQFGPYRILKLLGEGGMGVVYLAQRNDLHTQVAIKVLRDAWLSPARRERFASEQRTLAQLNHPCIARLYDAATVHDGTPYFVMEYVEGIPITQYCRDHRSSMEARLQLFRSVCEAVQHAHSHAVIHRDLKPSNILVKGDGAVRLLDFGIAKQLESLDLPVDQTMTGLRLMTPAYAAPEQIRGDRVGISTDVYSLGVILYELLTGELPFDLSNLTPAEAASIIAEHEPGRPSAAAKRATESEAKARAFSISKTAWADLDVLCLTAMHKDPQRRYRSVEALIRDIDHYLKGEPLEARPDTLRYRTTKFVRRNRHVVGATAAVSLIIIGLVTFFTVRLAKARDAAVEEAARTQRIQHFMTNLFQGGDESVGPSDELRVITLVDRGVQEVQALNSEPKVQAELYLTLGNIYEGLAKYEPADRLLRLALEERKSLFGADSPEVAESLVALGELRSDQSQYEEAEQLIRQGLEMSRRHLPRNHPAIGRATSSLGSVLERRGNYEQALEAFAEAERIQSAPGGSTTDLATTLTGLANSHYYLGHLDVSNSLNQRALALDRQIYGERHPDVAEDLINLGAIQLAWGHYKEAEQLNRQALDIIQSFYGKDHPETADLMTAVARTLVAQDRPDAAAGMLRDALGVEERVYGKMHSRVGLTLNELGKVAQQQGNLSEAATDFSHAVDIWRKVYNGKHYHIGVALSNLGDVYTAEKQYAKAERTLREALQMFAQTLPADQQNVGIARVRLGQVLLEQRRYINAETETSAGYEILAKQMDPSTDWLVKARHDLVEEYVALNEPEKAARFRAEQTNTPSAVLKTK